MNHMIAECRAKLAGFQGKNQAPKIYFAGRQWDLMDRAIKELDSFRADMSSGY
jgi:hypothetical protein